MSNIQRAFKATGDLVQVSATRAFESKEGVTLVSHGLEESVNIGGTWFLEKPALSELCVDRAGKSITMGTEIVKCLSKAAPKVGIAILVVGALYVTYKTVKYFSRENEVINSEHDKDER